MLLFIIITVFGYSYTRKLYSLICQTIKFNDGSPVTLTGSVIANSKRSTSVISLSLLMIDYTYSAGKRDRGKNSSVPLAIAQTNNNNQSHQIARCISITAAQPRRSPRLAPYKLITRALRAFSFTLTRALAQRA